MENKKLITAFCKFKIYQNENMYELYCNDVFEVSAGSIKLLKEIALNCF